MKVDCNLVREHLCSCAKELSRIGSVIRKETEDTCGHSSIKLNDTVIAIADVLRIDIVKTIEAEKAASAENRRVEWYKVATQKDSAYRQDSNATKEIGHSVDDPGGDSRHLNSARNDNRSVYVALMGVIEDTMHYTKKKEWEQHDTVENIYFALQAEMAGLSEIFQCGGLETETLDMRRSGNRNTDLKETQWDNAARKIAGVLVYSDKLVSAMPFDDRWTTAKYTK